MINAGVVRWSQDALVKANVVVSHSSRGEALLEDSPDLTPVKFAKAMNGGDGLLLVIDDKAGDTIVDHLRHRAAPKGDHGCPARHGLDHDETERFGPIDGKEERGGASEELALSRVVDFAHELHLFAVNERLKPLFKITGFLTRNFCGHAQRVAGGPCQAHGHLRTLLLRQATEEGEILSTFIGRPRLSAGNP